MDEKVQINTHKLDFQFAMGGYRMAWYTGFQRFSSLLSLHKQDQTNKLLQQWQKLGLERSPEALDFYFTASFEKAHFLCFLTVHHMKRIWSVAFFPIKGVCGLASFLWRVFGVWLFLSWWLFEVWLAFLWRVFYDLAWLFVEGVWGLACLLVGAWIFGCLGSGLCLLIITQI